MIRQENLLNIKKLCLVIQTIKTFSKSLCSKLQMFKYVVQEEIQYLVEQTKAENNQYEKIQNEIAAIEKDIENIEHDDNDRKVSNGLKNGLNHNDESTNDVSQSSEVTIIAQAPFKKEFKALPHEVSVDKVIECRFFNLFLTVLIS